MARVAVSRRYAGNLTPQDIRAVAVARGYHWCTGCGCWYHESAEGRHGGFRCKTARRKQKKESEN